MGRHVLPKFQIITDGDMSTTSITSTVSNIEYIDNIGIQLIWTGSPTGTVAVQVSVNHAQDAYGNVTVAGTWTQLVFSSDASPAGSASNFYYNAVSIAAPWIRVVYTKGSGTGTLNAFICGKKM
jgi:hypothetical protein